MRKIKIIVMLMIAVLLLSCARMDGAGLQEQASAANEAKVTSQTPTARSERQTTADTKAEVSKTPAVAETPYILPEKANKLPSNYKSGDSVDLEQLFPGLTGGDVIENEKYAFYTIDKRLIRLVKDTGEIEAIYQSEHWPMCYGAERIIFFDYIDNDIKSIDLDGNNEKVIFEGDVVTEKMGLASIKPYKDRLFYLFEKSALVEADLVTGESKHIDDRLISNAFFLNGYIYYVENITRSLYRMNLDTREKELVIGKEYDESNGEEYQADFDMRDLELIREGNSAGNGNRLWADQGFVVANNEIYSEYYGKLNDDGSFTHIVPEGQRILDIIEYGDDVYFITNLTSEYDSVISLYKYDTNTKDYAMLFDVPEIESSSEYYGASIVNDIFMYYIGKAGDYPADYELMGIKL